ncbi:MAG: PAS domain S-box protein, partial [Thermodesulfobacteriota bacterium]
MTDKPTYQDLVEKVMQLEEHERHYRSLSENSSDLLYRTDIHGAIVYVSESVFDLSGFTIEEALGMRMAEEVYVFPEERKELLATLQQEGQVTNFEVQLKRKDGSHWWASTNAHFYKDENGNILGVEGITRDITALKQTEEALRKSEANLAKAQQVAHIGNWSWDVETDSVLWSEEFYRIAGLIAEEFEATYENYLKCIHPDDLESVRSLKQNALKEKKSFSTEYRIIRKNKEIRYVHEQGDVTLDSHGNPLNLFGIVQDITAEKKIEKEKEAIQAAVIESKKMWENTFDTIPLMISIIDKKHEIVRMNRQMADVLGKPVAQLIHTPCYLTVHGVDAPPDYCPHSMLLQDQKVHRVEIYEKQLKAHLAVTVAPLFDGKNQLIGSVHIAQDISEQKRHEEELKSFNEKLKDLVDEQTHEIKERERQLLHAEKLNAVGRFSASIAHEFNNPLHGVLNVVRGVQKRATLSENDQELVRLAMKECCRMKDLLLNLQQFNRPTTGIKKELDLHGIIDEVLLFAKKECKNKKITIVKEYGEALPLVWAVADQIKQVLINMLGNACDATAGGGGEIIISTGYSNDKEVTIVIRDSGEGISPENIEHIFEPFFTTRAATTGTGLGLSTSYGIIKSHGGDIKVESEVGQG